jgi:hypothetical protein
VTALTERAARRMARNALDGLLEPGLSRQVDLMWPMLAAEADTAIHETLDALLHPSAALLDAAAKAACWAIGCKACSTWQECGGLTERNRQRNLDEARVVLGAVASVLAREAGIEPPPAEEQQS